MIKGRSKRFEPRRMTLNLIYNLYISKTYILHWLIWVCSGYDVVQVIYTIRSVKRASSHSSLWIADTIPTAVRFQMSKQIIVTGGQVIGVRRVVLVGLWSYRHTQPAG